MKKIKTAIVSQSPTILNTGTECTLWEIPEFWLDSDTDYPG